MTICWKCARVKTSPLKSAGAKDLVYYFKNILFFHQKVHLTFWTENVMMGNKKLILKRFGGNFELLETLLENSVSKNNLPLQATTIPIATVPLPPPDLQTIFCNQLQILQAWAILQSLKARIIQIHQHLQGKGKTAMVSCAMGWNIFKRRMKICCSLADLFFYKTPLR